MTPIAEVKAARKRAESMGVPHVWAPAFDQHSLAACIDNHMACIDVELAERAPDYTSTLFWLLNMARRINAYCDQARVAGDAAAEYWLERFLWRVDRVVNWDRLK